MSDEKRLLATIDEEAQRALRGVKVSFNHD
jgi:hypothetical protein